MKKSLMLKDEQEIKNLFETGRSVSRGVVLAKVLDSDTNKFLFAVSSKKFKRAVDRNRIKRLMREVVRKLEVENKKIAFIFIGKSLPTYSEIEFSIKSIISKV